MKTLRELAYFGGLEKLKTIQKDLDQLFEVLPELFPLGQVHAYRSNQIRAAKPAPKPVDKKAAAKRLIKGAEKLRLKQKPPSDQSGTTLVISEAARLLNVTNSCIRNYIKDGKLRVIDRQGPKNAMRLLSAEVMAYATSGTRPTVTETQQTVEEVTA